MANIYENDNVRSYWSIMELLAECEQEYVDDDHNCQTDDPDFSKKLHDILDGKLDVSNVSYIKFPKIEWVPQKITHSTKKLFGDEKEKSNINLKVKHNGTKKLIIKKPEN